MTVSLSQFELDSLTETLSQGAGHASAALSQMANHKINVSIPELKVVKIEEVINLIGNASDIMLSVYVNIDFQESSNRKSMGSMLLIFPPDSAIRVASLVQGSNEFNKKYLDELTEMDISALNEVGNILTGCSLSAISDFLGIKLIEGIPVSARDMLQASLDAIIAKLAEISDESMIFKTTFTFDDSRTNVYLFFIFGPDAIKLLKEKIALLL